MKFGQYELLELIAVGGMAEVYKGRVVGAEGFEKHVAIKRILPDLAADERFVNMLLTEARIHSALSHRNIVQIHDLGISGDGEYFIVLEFVDGYDLRMINDQLAAQGEIIPEALSLYVAAELAQGLHFAHELRGSDGSPMGLVHRDVSPSNVLISLAGEVKLSDFGLAKRREDRSVVGSLKGNLTYMSPEQARQAPLDRRTDVFSLGAVLFEMLTGRRLREITDELAGWSQVASGVVPSARSVRPDIPDPFVRLLDRALAVEPARRFSDAAAFGAAIRDVLRTMNTPVGASDLQTLLGVLSPPRRPRGTMERSKVIRLGPEAQALREAIAAPARPQPAALATVVTPAPGRARPAARRQSAASPAALDGSRSSGPSPAFDDMADTPPPARPLPPVGGRRAAPPSRTGSPIPIGRPARATPPGRIPAVRSSPLGAPSTSTSGSAPWGAGAAAYAVPRWHEHQGQVSPQPGGPIPVLAVAPVPTPRPYRETARVQTAAAGAWRPVVVAVAAVLIFAASAIHLLVLPLDVLFTWNRPAGLFIASEPEGASIKVDGVALADPAPTRISVRRDRLEHTIEVASPGYRAAREIVRYDQSVVLSFVLRLQKAAAAPVLDAPAGPSP